MSHELEIAIMVALGVPTENLVSFTIKGQMRGPMTVCAKYLVINPEWEYGESFLSDVTRKFTVIEEGKSNE